MRPLTVLITIHMWFDSWRRVVVWGAFTSPSDFTPRTGLRPTPAGCHCRCPVLVMAAPTIIAPNTASSTTAHHFPTRRPDRSTCTATRQLPSYPASFAVSVIGYLCYLRQGCFDVCYCLSVCLLQRSVKNYWTHLHEHFTTRVCGQGRIDRERPYAFVVSVIVFIWAALKNLD